MVRSKAHGTEPVRSWPWLCQPHTGVCLPPPEESAQDAKAAGTALVVLVGFAGELGGRSQTNTLRSAGQTEIMNRASQSIGTMGWSHPNKTLGVGGRSPGRPPPLLPSAVHSRQAEQTAVLAVIAHLPEGASFPPARLLMSSWTFVSVVF